VNLKIERVINEPWKKIENKAFTFFLYKERERKRVLFCEEEKVELLYGSVERERERMEMK